MAKMQKAMCTTIDWKLFFHVVLIYKKYFSANIYNKSN